MNQTTNTTSRFVCLSILFACWTLTAFAGEVSSDGLWQDVSEAEVQAHGSGVRILVPRNFRTLSLDLSGLRSLMADAPLELTSEAATKSPVITLPLPDGSFGRFYVQESPIMDPELSARLSDVRTYRANGIDDRAATARLDFTPEGFHGFILSPAGTIYIDPYRRGDTAHYMSYWRRDYSRPSGVAPFSCGFSEVNPAHPKSKPANGSSGDNPVTHAANGPTLRTYRLALAGTGEYTAFYGGTVAAAQAGMVTTMNRVNGIYEKEVAVRMTMVNNTSIVFADPGTDPYTNGDDLEANQETIDTIIGSANYDIGHLFGTGGGGVAFLGVVCEEGWKAQGLTGSGSPVADAFDVDYVAHEMGHQFGANHTFNSTQGACGGGNREAPAAYEPGSGSTIMAYAGICGASNLQPNSDAYFHSKSFDEIVEFINDAGTGNSCAVQTSTGNTAPVVNAGAPITIPMSTPFALTGSASDVDGGDTLTYSWEEFDLGTAAPPHTDSGNRPIFRSFNAATTPTRTFPKLSDILSGSATFGETLPTTTRTMTFRLTARDNVTGVNYSSKTVAVTSTSGPFVVTAPNTAVTWIAGTTQNVTWNVASTTAAPVSCAQVNILLSTDGGNTFPTSVVAGTPNDGTESVTVPSLATTTARIKVECATSPFFDISNANFAITIQTVMVATAASSTSVELSWNAIAGAVSYDVYRSSSLTAYSLIGSSNTPDFTDTTAAANTAYLYAVKWIDGSSTASAFGSPDLATTAIFTDPTVIAGVTELKADHITQLRTAVGAVRTLAGLGAFSFTDPMLTPGVSTAKAAHINDLRSALNPARTTLSLAPVTYTDPSVVSQVTPIRAAHINDVRSGVQ